MVLKNKSLSVIVCTYNRYDRLALCLDSLLDQKNIAFDYGIVVVDNTPHEKRDLDFHKKYLGNSTLTYKYIDTVGLSNARNVGIDSTVSDIISFIDDDAIASPNWANSVMTAFDFTDKTAVVGGKIDPIWESAIPEWLGNDLWGYLSVVNWGDNVKVCSKEEWVAGANISFKRSFIGTHRFDTNLGRNGNTLSLLSNEESVFVDKLLDSGYDLVYSPLAYVNHCVESSRVSQQWFRKRIIWQAISDFIGKAHKYDCSSYQHNFLKILWELPISERNVSAFYKQCENEPDFKKRLSLLYNFTFALLSGFETLEM